MLFASSVKSANFDFQQVSINYKQFPVTRYQGSKRKIVHWINDVLKSIDCKYDTVLDGFGGTASVSYLFKMLGKDVTYNDNLRFNFLIGQALIENQTTRLSKDHIENDLLNYQSLQQIVKRNFEGYYFLSDENEWIDNLAERVEQWYFNNRSYEAAIAYYALFQACLIKRPFNLFHRKNLYIRTNDVKRSFGNKTSWEQPFEALFYKFIDEANKLVFDNGRSCKAVNSSVFDIDEYGYDLVYLDPPYFVSKNVHETSDYFRCYHFLEGISKYSNWNNLIDQDTINKRLLYPDGGLKLTKSNISEKLEELICKFRNSIIVFSYKEGGVPSIEYLEGALKKHNKKVFIESVHYKYALNKQNGDASKNREVLIIAI